LLAEFGFVLLVVLNTVPKFEIEFQTQACDFCDVLTITMVRKVLLPSFQYFSSSRCIVGVDNEDRTVVLEYENTTFEATINLYE